MNNVDKTLQERNGRYGKFEDHAEIAQDLKDVLRDMPKYPELAADQKEALEMICHKIARILNGDPDYSDSWHDIAGYAQLIVKRLEGKAL